MESFVISIGFFSSDTVFDFVLVCSSTKRVVGIVVPSEDRTSEEEIGGGDGEPGELHKFGLSSPR